MNKIGRSVANATKWSLLSEIFVKLISPITNMVLARLLIPEAFGAVATITMIITFAEVFTDAGFQKYIVQHEFKDEEDFDLSVNVAFWSNLIFSLIIVVGIFIFRKQVAIIVGSPELDIGITVASLSILFHAFTSIQMSVYKRDFDFKTLFFVRMCLIVTPIIVTVPLAVVLRNYWALLIGNLVMNFVQAAILTAKSNWKPRFVYSFEKLKEMFAFSAWSLLESIALWLTSYIGTFIVGRLLTSYYLGLYKTAITTINSFLAIITASVLPVMFSALSRCQNDTEEFNKTYFDFQKLVSIISIPMGLGIFIFSDLITLILLGEQWMEASPFIGMYGLSANITVFIINMSGNVYRSKGNPKISFVAQLMYLGMMAPAIYYSALIGYNQLSIVRSLIAIPYLLLTLVIQQHFFGIRIVSVIKNIIPQVVSATIMGIFAVLLKVLFDNMIWHFVVVFLSVILYFSILLGCFPSIRSVVFSFPIVQKIIRKINLKWLSKMLERN